MAKRNLLSKSSFVRGNQCLKSLYLYKNFYNLKDRVSPQQLEKFRRGTVFGKAAHKLFPGGLDLSPGSAFQREKNVEKTKKAIKNGKTIIYEASFLYNDVYVAADIVVIENGKAEVYEVKSSATLSETFYLDAALQYYVISNAGLNVSDFYLVHPKPDTYYNANDYKSMFEIVCVTKTVSDMQGWIEQAIVGQKECLSSEVVPDIEIGDHCFSPYPCDYMSSCWKVYQKTAVFRMPDLSNTLRTQWLKEGILEVNSIPKSFPLTPLQKAFVKAEKLKTEHLDTKATKQFFLNLSYPYFIFDPVFYQPPLPVFPETKTYENIPIIFGVFYFEEISGKPEEHIWFSEASQPKINFLQNFLNATSKKGKILSYNFSQSLQFLKDSEKEYPEYKRKISNRIKRLMSYTEVYENGSFYSSRQEGEVTFESIAKTMSPGIFFRHKGCKTTENALALWLQFRQETDMFENEEYRNQLESFVKFRLNIFDKNLHTLLKKLEA